MRGNGNGTRSTHDIQAEIERTRGEMDRTLSAIEHRLTPGQLLDQGIDYLKNSGARQYIDNLAGSAKDNPIPLTLTGIGLAWLAAVSNRPVQYKFVERPSAGSSAPGPLDAMKEGATGLMDRTGETKDQIKERVAALGDTARQQAERAKRGWDTMLNEHPLALGAIGLALGAVAAAMVPRTQKEDEWMGGARDQLLDKAKEAGAEKLHQAQQVAKEALGQKKDEAKPSLKDAEVPSAETTLHPPSFPGSEGPGVRSGPRNPS